MVLTLYATTLFINDERLRLIDEQIEQTTSTLLAAQLDKEVIEDIDQFDFLLAEKLQFEPPNMFLTLFDKERKIIYQNYLARYHQLKPSSQLGWNSFLYNSHHLRSFTLDIKNGKEFLEVGLVLNRTNEIWGQSSLRLFGYIILIFLAAAAISYFLTQYLLKSLKQVSTYLTYLASNLQQINQADKKPIRSDFFNEFNQLILSVEKLKKKLELLVSDRRLFVAQMTHELKTPLAIILNQLELLPEEVKQTNAYKNIDAEIGQLSHTIQEFLEWTSVDKIPVEILETDAIDFPPKRRTEFKLRAQRISTSSLKAPYYARLFQI
jgi:signal transduction histidine kinase